MTLVSIVVVTYNSSKFIIDALDSVRSQTWKELELIITDDCSKDDTVEICRQWLRQNETRFVRTEILTSDKNTGIPGNVNRGLHSSKGVWINFLAGDDALKTNCIEDNMIWIASNPEAKVVFSRVEVYKETFISENLVSTIPIDPYNEASIMASNRNAKSQYKLLLLSDRIHYTPSVFLHRETLLYVGGFDERFKLLEDYPLWLNLTKNGYKLYFLDKITTKYRRHPKATNNIKNNHLINPNYFKTEAFRKLYTYPYLPIDLRFSQRYIWYISQIFRNKLNNNNIQTIRFLYKVLTIYANPFKYIIWCRKRLIRKLKNDDFYRY